MELHATVAGVWLVSAVITVFGTTVAVVGEVSAKNTVCSAGADGALVLFTVLGGWLDVVGFCLLWMLNSGPDFRNINSSIVQY